MYPAMILVVATILKFIIRLHFPTGISMIKNFEYWGIQMINLNKAATSNQQWEN